MEGWILLISEEEGVNVTTDVYRKDGKNEGPAMVFSKIDDAKRIAIGITLKAIEGFEKETKQTERLQALIDGNEFDKALEFIQKLAIKRLKQVVDVLTYCEIVPICSGAKAQEEQVVIEKQTSPFTCSFEDRLDV